MHLYGFTVIDPDFQQAIKDGNTIVAAGKKER